ncbi:MAG: protein phosphatase 2C domain-containing protein [Pirellulales bacterium]|nr:protein phosphatase 2C domain-containing protein [Pirellulales bacterium]
MGLRRANNQDAYAVSLAKTEEQWRSRGHLFLVADGMGAHAAGELASKLAADAVPLTYAKLADEPPAEAIRQAVEQANERIHERGQANAEFHGMGTTASTLLLLPAGALVAHVGDSRVYRQRGQRLDQLTFDHSLVWEMAAGGALRDDQVSAFIPKNIITRSLGPGPKVEVDREGPFPLAFGDTFLLCSDGLTGQVTDEELCGILASCPPDEAVRSLVDLANLRGGPDNITVIVARVVDPQLVTKAAGSESLAPAGSATGASKALLFGLAAAGLAAAGAVFFLAQMPAVAGLFGVAAVACLVGTVIASLAKRSVADNAVAAQPASGRFGRGPHRTCSCPPGALLVDELASISQQLQQAALEERWSIDWQRFRSLDEAATKAAQEKHFETAVRTRCQSISFMMNELRSQRSRERRVQ